MKIKVISTGKTTIDADRDYEEPPIRAALEELAELGPDETGRYLPDVAVAIVDHTDSGRSDISHDEYATVTEDDGTLLWAGWLDGRDEPAPLDLIALGQLVKNWEAAASEQDALADPAAAAAYVRHTVKAMALRECARQLAEALGQPS